MHPRLVDPQQACLLVIDLQEGYRSALWEWERTVARSRVMIQAAQLLDLPVLYTEQYPKGLGATAPEVQQVLGPAQRFEKRSISALGAPGLLEALLGLGRRQAIVVGIETHACINQTTHGLLQHGFAVHLAADALSSRRQFEHEQAYAKLLGSGAIPGSVEAIVLECLTSADHPQFKAVQALLK
jgi:nicotinamidase-related amidase